MCSHVLIQHPLPQCHVSFFPIHAPWQHHFPYCLHNLLAAASHQCSFTMPICKKCQQNIPTRNYRRHWAQCDHTSKRFYKRKRNSNDILITVDQQCVAATLRGDTHNASPSDAHHDYLHNHPSNRTLAKKNSVSNEHSISAPSHGTLPKENDNDDTLISHHDNSYPLFDSDPSPDAPSQESPDCIDQLLTDALKYIDPRVPDPFDPNSFDETQILFFPHQKSKCNVNCIPIHILAQLDLLRILPKGCSLHLFNSILSWVRHYSARFKTESKGDLWLDSPFKSQKCFASQLAQIAQTEKHKPNIVSATSLFDKRIIDVPTYNIDASINSAKNQRHGEDITQNIPSL